MVIRSKTMSFAGGMAVFPGGRIDDADFDLAEKLDHELEVDEAAARIAGMRETLEETGLAIGITNPVSADEALRARKMLLETIVLEPVLEKFNWTLDFDGLIPFARWLPQGVHHRVFDTRFYLADLGTGAVDIAVDETENTRLFWASAERVLEMAETGDVKVIYPTRRNLERLAQFPTFADAKKQADDIPVRIITPAIEERDGQKWLTIPDDIGYPVHGEPLEAVDRS